MKVIGQVEVVATTALVVACADAEEVASLRRFVEGEYLSTEVETEAVFSARRRRLFGLVSEITALQPEFSRLELTEAVFGQWYSWREIVRDRDMYNTLYGALRGYLSTLE